MLQNHLTKPPVARKLTSVRQLVFWLLVVSNKNAQLLLHSPFMLSMVKIQLKREVGGCALNSHGNYIVVHGKSWKKSWNSVYEFLWEPCYKKFLLYKQSMFDLIIT